MPGSGSIASSAARPAAEIDGGARERVVHRHDRVAVPRDPAPVAERAVERLAERERRVLDRVVVAGLEVAGALDDEVEPRVEGELLEEVVVDAGAGVDADAARAVEPEPHRDPRLRGRAQVPDAPPGRGRDGRRPVEHAGERLDEQVVVLAVADRDPDPVVVRAHDQPLPEQRVAERAPVLDRDEEEVRLRRQRLEADRARAPSASRSRSSIAGVTSGGDASAATASAAESDETGAGACRAFSSAASSREASA